MSSDYSIEDLYSEIKKPGEKKVTVYAAPPIRFSHKQSDYLYLLYRNIFKSSEYTINGLTGLKHIRTIFLFHKNKKIILHYHWLECTGFLNLPFFLLKFLCLLFFRWTGGRIVWTLHNKIPPDGKLFRINYSVHRWMAKKSELIHIQCRAVIPEISRFYGVDTSKFRFIQHPKYPHSLLPRATAVEAINLRHAANIKMQDKLFLMIGNISPYKGIESVCKIFMTLPVQKKLIIAGPVKRGQIKLYKRLKKLTNQAHNIILIPQFIGEENVPEFMNACDYVLFNFRDIFTSGGVYLALSYKKPIIVPDEPCMREIDYEDMHFFNSKEELKKLTEGL